MEQYKIIIIDLGSQTTNLIARRIREAGVLSEVVNHNISAKEILAKKPYGIILSGSPFSVTNEHYPKIDRKIFELNVPVLGICFGLYLIAEYLGGTVADASKKEYGPTELEVSDGDVLLNNVSRETLVWMNHGGEAKNIESIVSISASTTQCKLAAFSNQQKKLYAVQFHPEVEHTLEVQKILENFIFNICKAKKNWKLTDWVQDKLEEVKKIIGNDQAICAVSGGVDSTTTAVLCSKTIGKNLHCIYVDTGMMRQNETQEVKKVLGQYELNLKVIDAEERFFNKLKGVTDPEEKRKIAGHEYIKIFEEESKKLGNVKWLIQGTIYSDKIESSKSSEVASNIKSHHNVGGLPEKMDFKIYEPLYSLFKDEVRKVGNLLGLSKDITNRHPFPGPGIAIQIIGEVTKEKVEIVRQADAIAIEEIKKEGIYDKIGEIFTNFVGVKTTGVKGDERSYEWLLALCSVDPSDLMTSNWSRIPYDVLSRISYRITSEVPGVNRVVYDITTKPPATIRWE